MVPPARRVHLVARPGEEISLAEGHERVLALHLAGRRFSPGDGLALPGWPLLTVETLEPPGARITEHTRIELTVPPTHGAGPMHLAILVDASLTMGEGSSPTPYERAAALIDGVLMNGRSFVASAGMVLQGGETRHIEELAAPETLSGAAIHRVQPRGTFDLETGLERALDLLEAADGPRAILLVTDGDVAVARPDRAGLRVAKAGARLFAIADELPPGLAAACRHAGGRASEDAAEVFDRMAEECRAQARWSPPQDPEQVEADPEFESVIESMGGRRSTGGHQR